MNKIRIAIKPCIAAAYIYLGVPVAIFFVGWLKWYLAFCLIALLGVALFCGLRDSTDHVSYLEISPVSLFIIIIVSILWVLSSGIGGVVWQRADWNARNALLHDLINNSWPVIFEDGGGLSYYLCFWMVASVIGKSFGWQAANAALVLWSMVGLLLIMVLLLNLFKLDNSSLSHKKLIIVLAIFVLFGGLNVIGQFLVFIKGKGSMSFESIYGWTKYQYTPNNGLLEWAFNQAVPAWIVAVLLNNDIREKRIDRHGLMLMLLIPYSPFAALGVVPLLAIDALKSRFKGAFSIANIMALVSILPVFSAYYLCNGSLNGNTDLSPVGILRLDYGSVAYNVFIVLVFLVLEVGIYTVLIWNKYKDDLMFKAVILSLLIIPVVRIGPTRDFMLRGSIIPLFMLMCYVIETLFDKEFRKNRIWFVALVLCTVVGAYSGMGDFLLTMEKTMDSEVHNVADDVRSMNNRDLDWWNEYTGSSSYIVPNAEETFFFGVLGQSK